MTAWDVGHTVLPAWLTRNDLVLLMAKQTTNNIDDPLSPPGERLAKRRQQLRRVAVLRLVTGAVVFILILVGGRRTVRWCMHGIDSWDRDGEQIWLHALRISRYPLHSAILTSVRTVSSRNVMEVN